MKYCGQRIDLGMSDAETKPTTDSPRIFVIIPTHNRWDELRVALTCLKNSSFPNFELVLIDDGSTDGTGRNCRSEFSSVTILEGDGNLWWSGAINLGVEHALAQGADAIVWLNDDNRVEPETLTQLVESYLRQGKQSVSCARVQLIGADTEWAGRPPRWHADYESWKQPAVALPPDFPIAHPPGGQGVLIPAQCFRDVGEIDVKAFPHYWADHDFHYRAMKAGYKYFVATGAVVWNQPNKERPEAPKSVIGSLRGTLWFLFNRRSPMNIPTVRRLLKRHLSRTEYRRTFYPLLRRHLAWLGYEWLSRKRVYRWIRALKRTVRGSRPRN
jgi:GT2 family glycosyltransferase